MKQIEASQPSSLSSKLAITIDYATLRSLMLEYVEEQKGDSDDPADFNLERQLTLSGFLAWLRNRQRSK